MGMRQGNLGEAERRNTIDLRRLHHASDKERLAVRAAEYQDFFTANGRGVEERKRDYKRDYKKFLVDYYDLVAGLYEYAWGHSFHFAPRYIGESFAASLARHEHYLAHVLHLGPGMRVADFGCGIGGPAREIARFSQASIVGFDINEKELERARLHTEEAGLAGIIEFVASDFMDVDAPDCSFDAVYAIETTCCAPDKADVYGEAFRLLKPGACFAAYEYCMTDRFDPDNAQHREIKSNIEIGGGLVDIERPDQVRAALLEVGFEILETRDLALQDGPSVSWYEPLVGSGLSLASFRSSSVGRALIHRLLQAMELLRVVPRGTVHVNRLLNLAARGMIDSGRLGIFTPMYFLHARKPL